MRLKLSFEDISKLFNYIDKDGKGEVGYEEFTLLLEERWRGIDVVDMRKKELSQSKFQKNPMELTRNDEVKFKQDSVQGLTESEVFEKLEGFAKNKIKVPIHKNYQNIPKEKITNTNNASDLLYYAAQ